MENKQKLLQADPAKDKGSPIVVDYMKNKYNQYEKDKDVSKISLPSVVREPQKLDFSWNKVVDEKKKDTSGPVLKEQDILAFLMTASGNESGKSQYLNLVEAAGKNTTSSSSAAKSEVVENIAKDMTKNVRSMFEKGDTSNTATKATPKRISLIEDSAETNSVFENTPTARSDDIIKSGEAASEEEQVQKGTTKNLLDQWQKKSENKSHYVSSNKSLIKLVEDDSIKDQTLDNDNMQENDIIQKGFAKNLLNQWNNQNIEGVGADQINKDNQISSNDFEQTKGKIADAEVVQKGTAKSLLDQWNDKKNQTYVAPKQTVVLVQSVTTDSSITSKSTTDHQTAPNTDLLPKIAKSSTISNEPAKNDSVALPPEAVNQPTQEPIKSEETKEEEIDLDSLQKGLAKAMVLQWKSDHPDDSLDDIIQNATKTSGSYNEILLEKGIDKTLYEQWKYVKFKHLPKLDRSKKSLVINVPEKRTRPTVMQVMANRANEEANASTSSEKEAENFKNDTLEKILNKDDTSVNLKDSEKLPEKTELPQNNATTNVIKDKIPNNLEKYELNENQQKPDLNKNVVKNQLNDVKSEAKASVALSENLNTFSKSGTKDETVKTSDISNVDTIERGFAKNALEQLKQSVESSKIIEKKTILLSPVDDKVSENETAVPDTSNQRCEILEAQPVIQQGLTKHLLGQWQNKNTETVQFSKRRIIVDEDEGMIAENEPIISTDVIKSKDDEAKNLVEKGTAKMIMNQLIEGCKNKEISKSQKIIISETDGTVCENEPLSRDDIAKEDEQLPSALNVVQQGTTKNLLGRWNKITTDSSEVLKKEPVNLVLDSGHIIENEPVKRMDVVSSEPMQNDEIEKIERGFTKSLLNQWQNQNVITSTAKSKTKIEIREEDGSLSENNPETLENIARENETTYENKPVIQSGLAKSLVGQWQNKKLESFRNEKTPIVIEENDGQCAENEPITRENVVRSDQNKDETIIEKGYTKNILNQLKTIPLKSDVVKNKTPITISEQDGSVAENNPIQRSDVVKSGVDVEETFVQKGFTKSILNQWHEKKDNQTNSQKTAKIEIKEEDGQCVENEPIIRSDVIRSTDNALSDEINVGKGFTMNMLNQWQQNTNERSSGSSSRDKTPIVISHEDGKIVESIPIQRDDVAREGDANTNPIHVVQTGTAKQLKSQWQNLGNKTFEKENKTAVVISEDDGRIVESQPIERTDVVKSDQTDNDILSVESGITKSLVGHWKNKQMEEFTPEKKVIKIANDDGHVAENAPITRDDVAKESSTFENTSVVQKGTTKQLLNRWKNPDLVQKPSTKTTVQISKDDGVVAENEPIIRDDIIKADTPANTDEIVQKGITKSLTSQWSTSVSNETNKDKKIVLELDSGHVAENDPSPRRTDVFREENQNENFVEHMPLKGQASLIKQKLISAGQYKVQGSRKEPINIYGTNSNEKCVVENEPVKREGVAREDDENYADNVTVLKKGYAKNMAGFWTKPKSDANQNVKKQSVFELADGPAVYENDPQPSRKNEIQQVLEAGVFENNPVTREDVAREADFQPEIISAHATRNVRKLWSQKEAESTNPIVKTKKPEPVRFTPPREKSPPRQVKEEFKSTHSITFKKS